MTMEKFDKQRISGVPAITIRKNGSISLNSTASKEFPIKDKKHAALYFDKEEKAIGIQPVDAKPGTPTFTISREKGKTYTISCQAFLHQCGIPFKKGSPFRQLQHMFKETLSKDRYIMKLIPFWLNLWRQLQSLFLIIPDGWWVSKSLLNLFSQELK